MIFSGEAYAVRPQLAERLVLVKGAYAVKVYAAEADQLAVFADAELTAELSGKFVVCRVALRFLAQPLEAVKKVLLRDAGEFIPVLKDAAFTGFNDFFWRLRISSLTPFGWSRRAFARRDG